jgi:uncharacterized membrane protein YvbJ
VNRYWCEMCSDRDMCYRCRKDWEQDAPLIKRREAERDAARRRRRQIMFSRIVFLASMSLVGVMLLVASCLPRK